MSGELPGGPFRIADVTVRRWRAKDARPLADAVAASREHLLPWMPWAAARAPTLAERRRQFAQWAGEWRDGGDCVYGIFVGDQVAGGCGLHRRLGRTGLEIGYWLHPHHTGRGVMTTVAALLTDAAFTLPEIEAVEIHHDRANSASAGIPRRLGFAPLPELAREPEAPGEIGIECRWRMTRERWQVRQSPAGCSTRSKLAR